jgi:hypothetical protein
LYAREGEGEGEGEGERDKGREREREREREEGRGRGWRSGLTRIGLYVKEGEAGREGTEGEDRR